MCKKFRLTTLAAIREFHGFYERALLRTHHTPFICSPFNSIQQMLMNINVIAEFPQHVKFWYLDLKIS